MHGENPGGFIGPPPLSQKILKIIDIALIYTIEV
jgi:hypothetical protein